MKIQIVFVVVLFSVQSLFAIDLMIKDERIESIHLLTDNASQKHLSLFLAPAWYNRRGENESRPNPLPRDDHYFKIVSIDSSSMTDNTPVLGLSFTTVKSWSYTHCVPLGIFKNHVLLTNNDIAGITMWRDRVGFNPIDMFSVSRVPLENEANRKYTEFVSKYRSANSPVWMSPVLIANEVPIPRKKQIIEAAPPSGVFALSGMYDEKSGKGYCVGLSKAEEYDGVKIRPSARLWISSFFAPDFIVSEIKYKSETIVVKLPNIEEPVLQEVYTGDVKKDRFTHLAASFFITTPLIACYNNQNNSIHVIDYDPNLKLTQSPSRQVELPVEFQDQEVDSLLLTAGMDTAYLGIVFIGKNKEESKNFLIFQRTKESTDWKEFIRFELPGDSLSPTMCIQDGNLFYAYLQPTTVENPPQLVEK